MRLWVLSDLHLELTRGWDLPAGDARPDFDVLVVAGDLITRQERGVRWLLERVPDDRQVVYVAGNHESYGQDIDRDLEKARVAASGTAVHVLQNDSITIGGITFLGATGWTDFDLFGFQQRAMRTAGDVMNDYKKIRCANYTRRLRPAQTLARHMETRAFLERELSKPKSHPRVVVTHMSFHAEGVRRGHEHDEISAAYASRAAIEGADLWVYGHTHETRSFMAGGTLVLTNQKGYGPWSKNETWENKDFDPHFVIEI